VIVLLGVVVVVPGGFLVMRAILLQAQDLSEELPARLQTLADEMPARAQALADAAGARIPLIDPSVIGDVEPVIERALRDVGAMIRERADDLIGGVLLSARSLLGLLFFLLVVPVVAFYLLLDWDRMIGTVDDLLPREHQPTVRRLAREVDAALAGFLRGQASVMAIVGVFYATALALAGLNFGLVVGFVAGLVSFIPYLGAVVGGGLAIGLALFQFWGDWGMIAVIASIFLAGQVLEGNVLTPKLVGSSVGVHPVWLLLALSAFGAAFGFVGLLAAVPLAAVIGVLIRFGLSRYRESKLYLGRVPAALEPPAAAPPRRVGKAS
jgi:predicted PurR-regulated permease PerM